MTIRHMALIHLCVMYTLLCICLVLFWFLIFFLRQTLSYIARLNSNLLCSQGWPWISILLPLSLRELGLEGHSITPDFFGSGNQSSPVQALYQRIYTPCPRNITLINSHWSVDSEFMRDSLGGSAFVTGRLEDITCVPASSNTTPCSSLTEFKV